MCGRARVYKSSRHAHESSSWPLLRSNPLIGVRENGRLYPVPRLLVLPFARAAARRRPAAAGFRLRPLRAPDQSGVLHLLAHLDCRVLRVWHRGGVLQRRRLPRRRRPRAVPARRRLRRVLPGEMQGQEAVQHGGCPGRRHGPRQDEPHRPRDEQPGVRRHGPPRHGRAPHQARRRRRRVQEGAVRVQAQEPLGQSRREEPRPQRVGHQLPLPRRPDRHRRRRRCAGWVVELEVHDAGARPVVEHQQRAPGTAAAQAGGDRRLRRQVDLGRPGGPPEAVARRRGLRHGCPDH